VAISRRALLSSIQTLAAVFFQSHGTRDAVAQAQRHKSTRASIKYL